MARPLVAAAWRHLVLVTYRVPRGLVEGWVPRGVELELFDGEPVVSMVVLTFCEMRAWGIVPVPGLQRFAQWNLRTYVEERRGGRREAREERPGTVGAFGRGGGKSDAGSVVVEAHRGVVFLQEMVPAPVMAWGGRVVGDPFVCAPVRGGLQTGLGPGGQGAAARYSVVMGGVEHSIEAASDAPLLQPAEASMEHRLKERFFSYTRMRRGGGGRETDAGTRRLQVWHPAWRVYASPRVTVSVDWGRLYGAAWGVMARAEPMSVIFAEGSRAKMFPPRRWV